MDTQPTGTLYHFTHVWGEPEEGYLLKLPDGSGWYVHEAEILDPPWEGQLIGWKWGDEESRHNLVPVREGLDWGQCREIARLSAKVWLADNP